MTKKQAVLPGSSEAETQTEQQQTAEHAARAEASARTDGGPAELDAPPSNTASNSYQDGLFFQPLRWGVDSLYLSYPGALHREIENRLQALKKTAQSSETQEQIGAQYPVNGHLFEVRDKGAPLFPFVLEDNAYRIQLSRPGRKVPMAYVRVSSGILSHLGPAKAENDLREVLDSIGEISERANVSRIDLFVDFVSSQNMEAWQRDAWVTRAANINHYSEGAIFTGWMIGAGGVISCRLYDKTQEIKKSRKDYLKGLWAEAGWDGELRVWRLEFQYRRELLDQLGVVKLDSVLRHLNGLWSYATTEWLRLSLPDLADHNRSRWPIHPLWAALASVDWETQGGPLLKRFGNDRSPGQGWVYRTGFAVLTSYMAQEGIYDFDEGVKRLSLALYNHYSSRAIFEGVSFGELVNEKVRAKGRKFNTMCNLDEIADEDRKRRDLDELAWQYRKGAKGG